MQFLYDLVTVIREYTSKRSTSHEKSADADAMYVGDTSEDVPQESLNNVLFGKAEVMRGSISQETCQLSGTAL